MQDLNLRRFDPRSIRPGSVCVWVGGRYTGKTTNALWVMYNRRKIIDEATVFSATNSSNGDFTGHFPATFIHDEYDETLVENLLSLQRERKKELGEDCPWHSLILEDMFFDKERIHKHRAFREILMNGRHPHMDGPHYMVHYLMDFPKVFRQQVDYWFFMQDTNITNRKNIHEQIFGMVPNFKLFNNIMDVCCENYSAMVLDRRKAATSMNLEECIYWMRAPPKEELPERWHFGNKAYWRFDQINRRKKPKPKPRQLDRNNRNPINPKVRRRK